MTNDSMQDSGLNSGDSDREQPVQAQADAASNKQTTQTGPTADFSAPATNPTYTAAAPMPVQQTQGEPAMADPTEAQGSAGVVSDDANNDIVAAVKHRDSILKTSEGGDA